MDVHRGVARGVARGLFALAAALTATAVVAPLYDRPGGLSVLAELDHPVLLAVLAALSLTAGVLLSSRRPEVRKATVGGLVAAAVFGALATPVYVMASDPFPSREYDLPAPGGAQRRLVVERTSPLVDPVWRVYVDTGAFPTARRWPVAEYTESSWPTGVRQAEWIGPDRIALIDYDHRQHEVELSRDGRPLNEVDW
ncbi:hypothetical protein PV721_21395 [Streptomyces sp. MB09-01]|uniref:hypothetical protein n=1 Tax=Streptomyces sp. MB09-01 TaxID=3028666 RepID=UPI0029B13C05|nr:hypothetical protein [Streptomyces sp. MB09-01]MDX3536882.1 hypothetical protein [Streptomyces sp. MB09-01]